MWLFGRSKEASYKPVQRQVSITTTQEGPADRGDRYSVVSSPNGFPSSTSVVQEEDSASSFDQFNTSTSSSHREPLDPCTWSSVSSPGFATRVVNQANSSPLKEFNNGNSSLNRSYFSGSPNRHLKLGQLPYSSWRQRQTQSSPLHLPSSPNRRSRGRYSDNGTVFVRIAPVDPEKILLSPIPGSPVNNLPNLNSDNFGRSPPNGGLGGIPQTVLSAKFQRLWPSTNPIDRSLRMAPSPNSPSPGILEALANRKRSRVTDVYVDKTTTPMRSSMINTDDCPNKSSKRVKFLSEERNNRSLSMVPLHNLPDPDDNSMTSESILEQMNQTEKRFLPDEDPPASVRMLQKKKSPGTPRSSMQSSPFKKKKSPSSISIVEKDPKDKNDRFCTCTECYEEAAGVSSLLQQNTSPGCNDRSLSQPGSSRKSVTFNLPLQETTPTKSVTSTGTETDIMAREVIVRKSVAASGGIINMDMYKTDKKRRAERLRKILCLDQEANQSEEIPAAEQLRESSGTAATSTLPTSILGTNTAPFTGFGINPDTISSNDVVDGNKKDDTPATTFSFSQDNNTAANGIVETKEAPKAVGFSFGLPTPGAASSKEGETKLGANTGSESVIKVPTFGSTTTESSGASSTTTNTEHVPAFSFGGPKDPLLSSNQLLTPIKPQESAVSTSSFSPAGFSFGSGTTTATQSATNTSTVSSASTAPAGGFSFGGPKDPLLSSKEPAVTTSSFSPAGFSFGSSSGTPATTQSAINTSTTPSASIAPAGGFSFGSSTVTSTSSGSSLFSTGLNQQSSPLPTTMFGGLSNPATTEASKESTSATGSSALPIIPAVTLANNTPFTAFGLSKFDTVPSSSSDDKKKDDVLAPAFSFSQDKTATSGNLENKEAPAFSFGSTTTNTTAGNSTMFGSAPVTSTSTFGAPAPVTNTSTFGAPAPVTSTSTFGAPAPGTNPPLFGSAPGAQTSTFGSPAPTFSAPSTVANSSAFGSATSTGAFNFGSSSNTAAGNSNIFGSAPVSTPSTFGSPAPVTNPPAFGSTPGAQTSTFGSPAPAFGATSTVPNSSAFGSAPSSTGAFNFGSSTSNTTAGNSTIFGSAPVSSPPTFGSSVPVTSPLPFGSAPGAQTSTFGSPAPAFGATSTVPNASAFGNATTSNPPAFGSQTNSQQGFGTSSGSFNFQTPTQQTAAQQPGGFSFANNNASANGSNNNNSQGLFKFGQQAQPTQGTTTPAFGASATQNPPAFGSPMTSQPGFGLSGGGAFNFQSPTPQPAAQQPGAFSFANNSATANNSNNNSQGLFKFGQQAQPTQGTAPPAFGSSATQNPPAFGSQMTSQPGFGSPGGGGATGFNFQTPAQTTQPGGFSFAGANTSNNNNNSQGLFPYGQQPPAQSPQGGFNFTPQTNFTAGIPPQGGAQMFSLGSTNSTPSARRRDARPRRYR